MQNNKNPFSDPTPPSSVINIETVHPHSMKLLEHLQQGNSINFLGAREIGITHLDTHIASLRKDLKIHSRVIRLHNTRCMEYSLQAFE